MTPLTELRLAVAVSVIWLVAMTTMAGAELAFLVALIVAWCKGTA